MNHTELSHMAGAIADSTINIVVVIIIIIIIIMYKDCLWFYSILFFDLALLQVLFNMLIYLPTFWKPFLII